jgi:two-component system response regulator MtrA
VGTVHDGVPAIDGSGGTLSEVAKRLLVVEDDASVREAVTIVLERAGYELTAVADGAEALIALGEDPGYDLIVLDVMLPSVSGFDVCRAVRSRSGVPIVMLTARAEKEDIVAGLELGADDYLTKPFDPVELTARVRAVLRRARPDVDAGGERLAHRNIDVDESAYRAFKAGEELHLTTIEFRLLTELVRHAGQVMTREVLLERVWGYDYLGDSRLVDMAVKRLRDKLGDPPDDPPYINTVRGVGYRFERV